MSRNELKRMKEEYEWLLIMLHHPPENKTESYKYGWYEQTVENAREAIELKLKSINEKLDDDFDEWKELKVI